MPLATSFLAAKPEVTPGTWSAPTLAANALTVRNLTIDPFNTATLRRNIDKGFAGANPSIPSAVHRGYSFEMELAGSGTANTAVLWQTMLRGSMFGAGVPAGAQVGYPLTSTGDGDALSMMLLKDIILHEVRGARGNAVFTFNEKALPFVAFTGLGLFRTAGEVYKAGSSAGLSLAAYPAPVEVNLENTVITLDTFTLGVREFSLDLGMKTQLYSTTGSRQVIFGKDDEGDRRAAKFRMSFELPDSASKNYSASLAAGSVLPFTLVHGATAGNIIELSSTRAIAETISYSEDANRLFATVTGVCVPSASGNDEIVLVTK
jgi:hypothetical protein